MDKKGCMKEGLSHKESFNPSASAPSTTSDGNRTKHDNPRIKRQTGDSRKR